MEVFTLGDIIRDEPIPTKRYDKAVAALQSSTAERQAKTRDQYRTALRELGALGRANMVHRNRLFLQMGYPQIKVTHKKWLERCKAFGIETDRQGRNWYVWL